MTSKKKSIDITKRRSRAMQLRRAGGTLEAIAIVVSQEFNLTNYDRRRCFDDINWALKELNAECSHTTEVYRRQQLEQLDEYLFRLQPAIATGDTKAINSAIQIIDRKSKLLGLEFPMQLVVQEQTERAVDAELRSFLTSIQGLLSADAYRELMDAIVTIGERSANAEVN